MQVQVLSRAPNKKIPRKSGFFLFLVINAKKKKKIIFFKSNLWYNSIGFFVWKTFLLIIH
ncbi:hypothetical protein MDIS_01840 [Mesomycoplasma dispar]|nr:hypothetical protein MDIS_01840 [Mesomycoplasma dispar]